MRSDIFVEYPPQTRIDGEIQQLDADYPVKELWEVMAGKTEGRQSDRAITLFDSVGFAIEDFSALRYVRSKLEATGSTSNSTYWQIRMNQETSTACCCAASKAFTGNKAGDYSVCRVDYQTGLKKIKLSAALHLAFTN